MLVICHNCGKEILTEADTFVFQHRFDKDYYSCGCKEFKKEILDKRKNYKEKLNGK